MKIWTNLANRIIIDTFIQKIAIRSNVGFENELIMGIKFSNSVVVKELKGLITGYAKQQYLDENYDAVRYTVRDNWSADIWRLLRVCYDLSNFKLIDKVYVNDIGIAVTYTIKTPNSDDKTLRMLLKNESDLNELRMNVNDTCSNISTFEFYSGEYFKLNHEGRKSYKEKHSSKQLESVRRNSETNNIGPSSAHENNQSNLEC